VITTAFEHHAVLKPMQKLMREGFDVTFLPVPEDGILQPLELEKAIRPDTCFVSVMLANNEIGTIQPIREIAEICRSRQILFHTDAVQAVGHIPVDLKELGVDYLSASAHKFGGPKGIGFLYTRQGAFLSSVMEGGEQERGKRAGTENVAGAVGMAKALEISKSHLAEEQKKVTELRNRLAEGLLQIPGTRINGSMAEGMRVPGNVNVTISGVDAATALILLDSKGICASAGAACMAGATEPSHVLAAIGLSPEDVSSSLRFSLGADNTEEEVDYIIDVVREQTARLRR
jgi:cysteine desulfurase